MITWTLIKWLRDFDSLSIGTNWSDFIAVEDENFIVTFSSKSNRVSFNDAPEVFNIDNELIVAFVKKHPQEPNQASIGLDDKNDDNCLPNSIFGFTKITRKNALQSARPEPRTRKHSYQDTTTRTLEISKWHEIFLASD